MKVFFLTFEKEEVESRLWNRALVPYPDSPRSVSVHITRPALHAGSPRFNARRNSRQSSVPVFYEVYQPT